MHTLRWRQCLQLNKHSVRLQVLQLQVLQLLLQPHGVGCLPLCISGCSIPLQLQIAHSSRCMRQRCGLRGVHLLRRLRRCHRLPLGVLRTKTYTLVKMHATLTCVRLSA